jgi:hypothetical protein
MAHVSANRVTESTTTTGTGALALAGALAGFRPFSGVMSVGDTCWYALWSVDSNGAATGDYEAGLGTYSATSTLSRTTVLDSSNSGSAVSLSAGTTYVSIALIAGKSVQLDVEDAMVMPASAGDPVLSPIASMLKLYGRLYAGRALPFFLGPGGSPMPVQGSVLRERMGLWIPPGNGTTTPGVLGLSALAVTGVSTGRNVATTNYLTRQRRLGQASSATAGNLAGVRVSTAQLTVGDGSGNGGFFYGCIFGTSDAASVSGARAFIGLSSSTSAPTNVEPNTLTNSVGIAQLSTDATQWYLVYGGSAAQTEVALGTGLGAPTDTTTAYELVLYSSPEDNGIVSYEVTNLGTGVKVVGTINPTTPGTQLPSSTTFITTQIWRSNNATALAVGIDIAAIYEGMVQ